MEAAILNKELMDVCFFLMINLTIFNHISVFLLQTTSDMLLNILKVWLTNV